jgi:hypothetical protein
MTMQKVMSVLIGMMFVFAGIVSAQQVSTDYDRSANFAHYRSYSWLHVKTRDPLSVDRIKHAVNTALAAKGWRRFGGGHFGESTTTSDTYKVGTVVVDLFNARTKQLIWRGTASDTLSDNSDKNIKNLDEGVDKLFKHFPPSATKK